MTDYSAERSLLFFLLLNAAVFGSALLFVVRCMTRVRSQALLDASHPSTLVIPLTTTLIKDAEPLRIRVAAADKLQRDSDLLIDQLRSIDNERLIQGPLCQLDEALLSRVEVAVREVLDMDEGR